jgi:hypothetical protein
MLADLQRKKVWDDEIPRRNNREDGCTVAGLHAAGRRGVKYGALSVPDGRVSISGKIDGYDGARSFVFSWKETGGQRVAQPTRRGFGSAILLEGTEQFGTVAMKYLPDGLIYQLHLDLKAIEVLKNVPTVPNKPNVVARENV